MDTLKLNLKKASHFQLFAFALSFLSLAGALASQYVFDLYPCTYCIVARYVLSFIAVFSILGFITSYYASKSTTKLRNFKLFSKISALMSLIILFNLFFGFYISIKHYIVVFQNNLSCGRDALQEHLNNLFLAKLWPAMYEATGNCVDANYKLFNILDYVHLPMIIYIITLNLMIFYFLNYFKKSTN